MPQSPRQGGFFYGWVMLGVAVLMAAATMPGQTVLMALFNASIRESLGLSIEQISGAYTIGTIIASLPLPLVGRIADRLGLRRRLGLRVEAQGAPLVDALLRHLRPL